MLFFSTNLSGDIGRIDPEIGSSHCLYILCIMEHADSAILLLPNQSFMKSKLSC
jgi:hypothetical protein